MDGGTPVPMASGGATTRGGLMPASSRNSTQHAARDQTRDQTRDGARDGTGSFWATSLRGAAPVAALGVAVGMLRYWFGFFVLIQGAAMAGLVAWGVAAFCAGGGQAGKGPAHPGPALALRHALLWTACFVVAECVGMVAVLPGRDVPSWLLRVLEGDAAEPVFGIAATGPVHRAFAGGASGVFWVALNAIDLAIMLIFFMALPWAPPARGSRGIHRGALRDTSGRTPRARSGRGKAAS